MVTTLRQLTPDDIEDVLQLQDECYELPLREQPSAFLSKLLSSPSTCYGVYLGDKRLIAYGFALPCTTTDLPELNSVTPQRIVADTLYIHDIAVTPSMRRFGLGSQIVELLTQDALRLNLPTLTLTAVEGSVSYWLSRGFQQVKEGSPSYGRGAYQMRLSLNSNTSNA